MNVSDRGLSLQRSPFARLSGWQRGLLVFLAGAVMSLALPPADFWPAVFVAFPVLVFALDVVAAAGRSNRTALARGLITGWLFGFGFFVTSLYWIGAAFLVEPEKFAALMPFAVAALPAFLSLFWGLAAAVAVARWPRGFWRVVLLAVLLTLAEWLRGHVLTGFPWNVIGFAASGMGGIVQFAAFAGFFGLTFAILIWAGIGVVMVSSNRKAVPVLLLAVSFVTAWHMGNARVGSLDTIAGKAPFVRIVQPNIAQREKWARPFLQRNIERLFALSQQPTADAAISPDIIVWPESALPVLYERSRALQRRVARMLKPGSILVMGAIRQRRSGGRVQTYNSVLVVDHTGGVVARYDKTHLVPFGEYLPYRSVLTRIGLKKLVTLPGGFAIGRDTKLLKPENLPPLAASICYEIIFPTEVIPPATRPRWIVNVTNDAWFGNTAGPYQHLAQARFRAIEQGLPVVRSANTGISAVISPFGQFIKTLSLDRRGVIDTVLPMPIAQTLYARLGDRPILIILVAIAMVIMAFAPATRSGYEPDKEL